MVIAHLSTTNKKWCNRSRSNVTTRKRVYHNNHNNHTNNNKVNNLGKYVLQSLMFGILIFLISGGDHKSISSLSLSSSSSLLPILLVEAGRFEERFARQSELFSRGDIPQQEIINIQQSSTESISDTNRNTNSNSNINSNHNTIDQNNSNNNYVVLDPVVFHDLMGDPLPVPSDLTTDELKQRRHRKLQYYSQRSTIVKIEPSVNQNGMFYPDSKVSVSQSNEHFTEEWKQHIKKMEREGRKQWKQAGKLNKLVGLEKEYFSCMKCDKCNKHDIFGVKCYYSEYCDICRG